MRGRSLSGLFTFLLLGAYALLMLLVAVTAGQAYSGITDDADANEAVRSTALYITGKMRGCGSLERTEVLKSEQGDAIALSSEHSGKEYITYIYAHEGELKEYFAEASRSFDASLGQRVAFAGTLKADIEGGLFTATVTQDGEEVSFSLYLCGGDER